ncbi:chemotaxis protein CheW [candidate division KSB1 bacterium]|nr:chemotaxis protein CheW [candidate division KSB1 bacterium]
MPAESQWVTFKVGNEMFGFEIEYVKEMLRMPDVHAVPQAAPDNLGVILLRDRTIPVFDLRRKFGFESRQDKAAVLVETLKARQQDHENWLKELEASVRENREFKLTTDPHQCKFGLWYDSYSTDDPFLDRIIKRFNQPHKLIHALAERVSRELADGQQQSALRMIEDVRSTSLNQLIGIFAEACEYVIASARPTLVIVGSSACTLGVAVDEINAVIRCADDEIQAPDSIPAIEQFPGLVGLVAEKSRGKFTMLLDPAQLYPQLIPQTEYA